MKKEELAFIGCRLIALYYVAKVLETIGSFMMSLVMWRSQTINLPTADMKIIYLHILPFTFYGIIACLPALVWCRHDRAVSITGYRDKSKFA